MAPAFFPFIKLRADQLTQFAFDYAIMFMGVIDNFMANLDVFVERLMAGVNHYAGKPFVDALLAQLERIAMIQMNGDGNVREDHGGLDQLFEVNRVRVIT